MIQFRFLFVLLFGFVSLTLFSQTIDTVSSNKGILILKQEVKKDSFIVYYKTIDTLSMLIEDRYSSLYSDSIINSNYFFSNSLYFSPKTKLISSNWVLASNSLAFNISKNVNLKFSLVSFKIFTFLPEITFATSVSKNVKLGIRAGYSSLELPNSEPTYQPTSFLYSKGIISIGNINNNIAIGMGISHISLQDNLQPIVSIAYLLKKENVGFVGEAQGIYYNNRLHNYFLMGSRYYKNTFALDLGFIFSYPTYNVGFMAKVPLFPWLKLNFPIGVRKKVKAHKLREQVNTSH